MKAHQIELKVIVTEKKIGMKYADMIKSVLMGSLPGRGISTPDMERGAGMVDDIDRVMQSAPKKNPAIWWASEDDYKHLMQKIENFAWSDFAVANVEIKCLLVDMIKYLRTCKTPQDLPGTITTKAKK